MSYKKQGQTTGATNTNAAAGESGAGSGTSHELPSGIGEL
jgi:hypothetical protein